ncbi:molybdenum cofactor biosynthesis protein [Thermotoga sp. Ku-13t]|nr:molybdenum cofactor biosynthesis protein [Thermotoga sp. Ku-13t]
MDRKIYLKKMDLDQALRLYLTRLKKIGFFEPKTERIGVGEALDRVLAAAVFARRSVPHYSAAAVDGIAVRSVDTTQASKRNPRRLTENQFLFVNTGQPLPGGFDAVIMMEDVHLLGDGSVEILDPVPPFHNVRTIGEDVIEHDMLFTKFHRLAPQDLSLLLAAGVFEVEVIRKIDCAVVPTGDEIVEPAGEPKDGFIPETNSTLVKAFLEKLGANVKVYGTLGDDPVRIESTLRRILIDHDLVLFIGGSSAGSRDFVYRVLENVGEVIVHGLSIRPGKPTVLALVENKPVIGLPGFPASCYTVLERIVKPIVQEWYHQPVETKDYIEAESATRIFSSVGDEEFVRVALAKVKERYLCVPLKRGAATMSSLTRMDGTIVVPKGQEVVEEGERIAIQLEVPKSQIDGTVLFIGSNDPLIDLMTNLLAERGVRLSAVSVGSLGGVRAIARSFAHLAGIHLFDPESETYNLPYLRRMLKRFVLVKFARRLQGIVVQKGNPKSIRTLYDLARKDVRFVNRQKASGTRILLDHYLSKLGIDHHEINGYDSEEITHIAVALKIKKNQADAGLAVAHVAQLMDLDFVPLCWEEYDLLILPEFVEDERFQIIIDTIKSKEFRNLVLRCAGYDISDMGKIVVEGEPV